MNALAKELVSSAKSNHRTAMYCRERALIEEATKCPELAEKWWGYYSQYRSAVTDNIKSARRALS